MSSPIVIDLSSDEETEASTLKDETPKIALCILQSNASDDPANKQPKVEQCEMVDVFKENANPNIVSRASDGSSDTELTRSSANALCQPSASFATSAPLCRQFWKAGDYDAELVTGPAFQNSQNRLCIHPRFLHSNATSHKWVFGAIAELLDNAVDEIQNGATFVVIDKIINPRDGTPALLVQDDGGGMDPESLRRCISFGFSEKPSHSSIGQYGNGFKTSTMRLGSDVIIFSRRMNARGIRTSTQSVGLLSYTFLRKTGCHDVVVPVVDYSLDPLTGVYERFFRHSQREFSSNLSTLLKWSPFATEVELLKQFDDIQNHGTKVLIYNLWLNDKGNMELDFDIDAEDIVLSRAPKPIQTNKIMTILNQKHIANRFHFSLRVYSSILYLHIPEHFRIILRGREVVPYKLAKGLRYPELIKYRPQVGRKIEAEVLTTIGFLEGAPNISVHGFNIYHKNRLILPFCQVVSVGNSRGRGVAGFLEANFIKPTHDKQGFENSNLYRKLENRLKEMTLEYWHYHCHLIGYTSRFSPSTLVPSVAASPQQPSMRTSDGLQPIMEDSMPAPYHPMPCSNSSTVIPKLEQREPFVGSLSSPQTGLLGKRRDETRISEKESSKRNNVGVAGIADSPGGNQKSKIDKNNGLRRVQEFTIMMKANKDLHKACEVYEERNTELSLKAQRLKDELKEVQQVYQKLLAERNSMDKIKTENF